MEKIINHMSNLFGRKAVATEMLLTVGILIAVGIAMIQIKSVFFSEQKISQQDIVNEFARDIESIVDKLSSTTGNGTFTYEPQIKKYKLEVKDSIVTIKDSVSGKSTWFAKSQINLKNTIVQDSKIIYISRIEDQIFILGRCLEIGEECSSSFVCCKNNPCWGKTKFICQEECAPNGEKAADNEACCSEFLNKETGICDEPPYCPQSKICPGAPEAEDVAGEDCCRGETPICTNGHCCPSDKPKWCDSPEDGEKRCMTNEEFREKCKSGEVLIVALKSNMKKVYSDAQINEIEAKINEYINSLNNDGLGGQLLYLDEDETSDIIGSKVTSPSSPTNIDGILDQVIKKMNIKYLVIVGGYDRFPQAPIKGTKEPQAETDDTYGDINKDNIADIAVGRVLDPNNGDVNLLIKSFDTFISLHNSGGLDFSNSIVFTPTRACGASHSKRCATGECFAELILKTSCSSSNCIFDTPFYERSNNNFLYYVEHGGPSVPQQYDSFTSGSVASVTFSKNLLMVVCCWGGNIRPYDRTSDSIPMVFFKNGGAVFFGSTDPNCCANELSTCTENIDMGGIGAVYYHIAKKMAVGKRVGDAYKEGKESYLKYASSVTSKSSQAGINCLYGDPTLNIKKMW